MTPPPAPGECEPKPAEAASQTADPVPDDTRAAGSKLLQFEVRRLGEPLQSFTAEADPTDPDQLRRLLAAAVRRDGRDTSEILDYEMDVRRSDRSLVTTYVTMTA